MRTVGTGENSLFTKPIHHVGRVVRRRRACGLREHQVKTQKKPRSSYITNQRTPPLQFTKFANEQIAHTQRVCLQFFVPHYVEHCEPHRAGNGISAKGAEKFHAIIKLARDFTCGDHRGQRKRISNRLAEHHDVRHDALRLEPPKVRTEPAESHLHLVRNANAASRANMAIRFAEVIGRKDNLPADARQSLGDVSWSLPLGSQLAANFSDVFRIFRSEMSLASAIDSSIVV